MSLVGSGLGIGISIAVAEGFKKRDAHLRIKKTMGYLKLVAVPYLKNQAENLEDTLKKWQDICSLEAAFAFLIIVANLDGIVEAFDKSWLNLVYSQDSIEAINDDEFNKTANTIFELILFTKTLAAASARAKNLLVNDITSLKANDEHAAKFLDETRLLRNDLNDAVAKLVKYTDRFSEELDVFFKRNGMKYEEFDR